MMNTKAALARGHITTWAGTTRVWASERGVREVKLPDWRRGMPQDARDESRIVIEAECGTAA
ncbi:MAG TPA: hypothetical protein VJN88_11230, partial [Ktedonobacterales bacterium]|nr:hypothetical protein [Ktedonobacterales bacterium]